MQHCQGRAGESIPRLWIALESELTSALESTLVVTDVFTDSQISILSLGNWLQYINKEWTKLSEDLFAGQRIQFETVMHALVG